MKIYFSGSISGGRQDAALYQRWIHFLKEYGEVLTEHIGDPQLQPGETTILDDKGIHDRDLEWLESADVVIAEVTVPSLGVGYELGQARAMNKPVICLFRPGNGKRLSAMIAGCEDFVCLRYQEIAEIEDKVISILKMM
ncbi:MAG: nucleoside 2-deoxyribosyltransferase [Bacteroidia bacterium]